MIAADGQFLLSAIDAATQQSWLREIPAVTTLRHVWAEQYVEREGRLFFRPVKEMPSPAALLTSPYETEARYSTKSGMTWVGYKVHLTETCDEHHPNLIVNVETTPATTPDDNPLSVVHESLQKRDLLPAEHLVWPENANVLSFVSADPSSCRCYVVPSWEFTNGFRCAMTFVGWTSRLFRSETGVRLSLEPKRTIRSAGVPFPNPA